MKVFFSLNIKKTHTKGFEPVSSYTKLLIKLLTHFLLAPSPCIETLSVSLNISTDVTFALNFNCLFWFAPYKLYGTSVDSKNNFCG